MQIRLIILKLDNIIQILGINENIHEYIIRIDHSSV